MLPFNIGFPELILLLVAGVVLFGRKLPDIGKSVAKTIVDFRNVMSGKEEPHLDGSARGEIAADTVRAPQRITAPSAPKFEDNGSAAPKV